MSCLPTLITFEVDMQQPLFCMVLYAYDKPPDELLMRAGRHPDHTMLQEVCARTLLAQCVCVAVAVGDSGCGASFLS